ncbi:hypothetical protein BDV96DRAFT_628229 [Lophiotrema nucula]|uniref:Uncharacterized protein n=1 Tax=Lophiotrema nucula TaxID=690887 RepID=A0A6A5ZNG6_9PLEO|nr:hypothetical protein BDV96DRAFT_628229 [Lophiotrema nucula]
MQNVLCALLLLLAAAFATPNSFAEFVAPILEEPSPTIDNETIADGGPELLRRQGDACATNYSNCNIIGFAGLCCRKSQVCSADAAGHPACCPSQAACTGTIGAIPIATGTVSSQSFVVVSTTSTTTVGGIFTGTATATGNGFQQSEGAGTRSWVSNAFFPIAYLPTTYTNAAACSSAYSSCQSDAARCTADLASGQQGVTISAPNGGATVTAIPSYGEASASSICSSLSQAACSGSWNVQACSTYGSGNGAVGRGCGYGQLYTVGAVAMGVAGQMLR